MVRLGSPSIDVDVRHDDRFITWHVLTLITKLVEKVWGAVWAT